MYRYTNAIIDYANKVIEENKNQSDLAAQEYEHEEQKRKEVEMAVLNARANFGNPDKKWPGPGNPGAPGDPGVITRNKYDREYF